MASRRDELNAYTFAKRRTVAAFLQPSPTGTEEGAPRPLRAVLPGVIVGALVMAGFGAYGMFKPAIPKDWDKPEAAVIVGKESTTRYVVLRTKEGGRTTTLLHPVLNLASARLLLSGANVGVVQVADKVLDAGTPPRGPVLGIPFAPDRLPAAKDAGTAKRWAVCEQPGGQSRTVQKATFVLAAQDPGSKKLDEQGRKLVGGQVLYVRGQDQQRYLVDGSGVKYPIRATDAAQDATLTQALVGGREPQSVTKDWLATLHDGTPVTFPVVPGTVGDPAGAPGTLSEEENRIGMVLQSETGDGTKHYVVLKGKVQPVSAFTAWLLINSPQTTTLNLNGQATKVGLADFTPDPETFAGQGARWPQQRAVQVNAADGNRDTVCSVLNKVGADGSTTLTTWAGTAYPADVTSIGTSTYVTPGTGLLYTQVQGQQSESGSLFLLTDTGLRYALQANGDSDAAASDIGAADTGSTQDGRPQPSAAQTKLGYGDVTPATVPAAWSEFLSKGPRLDINSARQPQGS
jgi:type VII secretion protein EccB